MTQKQRKTLDFLFYALLPAALLHFLFLLIFKEEMDLTGVLFICIVMMILISLPWFFYKTHSENTAIKAQQQIWMLLFLVYVFQLAYLLFFSVDFARDRVNYLNGDYYQALLQQWQYGTNLTPFYTIKGMLAIFHIETISNRIAIINLLGNLIAFTPFSFFLPKLFSHTRKARHFLITMAALILCVEILQFLTLTGSMDIDDFILNFTGCLLAFIPIWLYYRVKQRRGS